MVATPTQLPVSGVGSPEVLIGGPNRLLILCYCASFATAGWFLVRSAENRDTRRLVNLGCVSTRLAQAAACPWQTTLADSTSSLKDEHP